MALRKSSSGSALLDFVAPGVRHVFSTRTGRGLAIAGAAAVVATVAVRERGSPLPPTATRYLSLATASISDGAYDAADAVLGPAADILDAKVDGMSRFLERRFKEVRANLDAAVVAVDRTLNPDDYSDQEVSVTSSISSQVKAPSIPGRSPGRARSHELKSKPTRRRISTAEGYRGPSF